MNLISLEALLGKPVEEFDRMRPASLGVRCSVGMSVKDLAVVSVRRQVWTPVRRSIRISAEGLK